MTIGERIRQARINKKLSMEELANMIGKKAPVIYKYENDMVDMPASVIKALHNILDMSYLDLIDDADSDDREILEAYHALEDPKKEMIRDALRLPEKEKTQTLESSTG